MTTDERNVFLQTLFSRLESIITFDCNGVSVGANSVSFYLHREGRWDDHDYATVHFTFDELCDPNISLESATDTRFVADVERRDAEKRAAEQVKLDNEKRARKAATARAKKRSEAKQLETFLKLKARFEPSA